MVRAKQQLLPKPFNPTSMFLYSGQTINGHIASYPGPMIIAKKDVPITVRWVNEIQGKHILPVDYSYPFKNSSIFRNEVPVVPHAHGIASLTVSDG
jgi:spore coat protein A, manganese oxidase